MDWAQIIVVILSICLGLFIIVAIALIVTVLRLTFQIKSLMRSAQQAAENMSHIAAEVGVVTKILALVSAARQKVKNRKRRKEV